MPATILVAVHDPELREFLLRALGDEYRILEARDGRAALKLCEREQPDLLIAAFLMPNMDGEALARELRRIESTRTTPLVFIAPVHRTREVRDLAHAIGAQAVLAKPVTDVTVRDVVRQVLQSGESNAVDAGALSHEDGAPAESVAAMSASLFAPHDIGSLAHAASEVARELLFAEFAHVYLEEAGGAAASVSACGLGEDACAALLASPSFRAAHDELLAGRGVVLTHSAAAATSDAGADVRSLLAVPIPAQSPAAAGGAQTRGFVCALNRIGAVEFSAADIRAAQALAAQIALADATRQQRAVAAAEVERAHRELDAFSYAVAHDLRGPLRLIDAQVQMLGLMTQELPRPVVVQLEQIQRGAANLNALVAGLLTVSRVRQLEMKPRTVALRAVVDAAIGALSADTAGRAIEWRIGALPTVSCDPEFMRQVFVNLLGNAVKYTRPRAHAQIEIGSAATPVPHIYIRDNGVGFDMSYGGKLFGLFQRLHRQDEFEGTGVGLAIASRLIERHGGRIWAEAAPGQGATFRFSLAGLA